MKAKEKANMTEGGMIKALLLFILPLIGSSLFQQLYNTADYYFVGNDLGRSAAAAVGASSSLITCTIGLFTGISLGTNVIVAQYIGAKRNVEADKALHTSLTFGLIGGIILSFLAIVFTQVILMALKTPQSAMEEAVLYMRIYLLSLPMTILYNMGAGALRACGDSKTPFHILVICGFVNVIADMICIKLFRWGVGGVAVATVIAQTLSVVLVLYSLSKEGRAIRFIFRKMAIDWCILKQILKIGLPSGFQSIMITFSNVVVQYYINSFGEVAVAAFATYYKVENFIYLPIMAFGQAATTFTGQNKGAQKYDRIRKGIPVIAAMGSGVVLCIACIMLTFPDQIFGLFIKDADVVANTLKIASISFPFYWIYPIMEVTSGSVRALGRSFGSMVIVLLNICALRIMLLAIFAQTTNTLEALASVYPITWACSTICFCIIFIKIMYKEQKKEQSKRENLRPNRI